MDNNELMASDKVNVPNEATVPDQLDGLPNEMPAEVRSVFRQSMSFMGMMTGSRESSIVKKITEEHIDKMLDNDKAEMEFEDKEKERNHKDKAQNRLLIMMIVVIMAVLAAFVLFFYRDDADTVLKIIVPVITFLTGAVGGYFGGYGKAKRDS